MDTGDCGRENPSSFLVHRLTDRVLKIVRKMTTLRGSPWYTPLQRGTGLVDHSSQGWRSKVGRGAIAPPPPQG